MRILQKTKDGGPESTVDAFTLIEIKSLFSIILLRFNKGSRENFHSHAFNAFTWFLKGHLEEELIDGTTRRYRRRIIPKLTPRDNCHKVHAKQTSWCFTLRGPWCKTWEEYTPDKKQRITLSNGRKILKIEEA